MTSSAGWKMHLMPYCNGAVDKAHASASTTAACTSWPQAWETPGTTEA